MSTYFVFRIKTRRSTETVRLLSTSLETAIEAMSRATVDGEPVEFEFVREESGT